MRDGRMRPCGIQQILSGVFCEQGDNAAADSAWRGGSEGADVSGYGIFQLLAARGKTVRMVTYPGSPHFPVLLGAAARCDA